MPTVTIGLISDTHIPHRLGRLPQAVFDALAGVDVILHAGDVDEPSALAPLQAIAPVRAVRGNFHIQDLSDGGATLPATARLHIAGRHILLIHGHRPGILGFFLKGLDVFAQRLNLSDNGRSNRRIARRLARLYPDADIVVFGHTHRAHVEWVGRTLMINPGGVCVTPKEEPTVARLRLGAGTPEVEIIPLPLQAPGFQADQAGPMAKNNMPI